MRVHRSFRSDARRGFTLIELLVVIAIIAVLIALLLAGRASGPRGGSAHPVHEQHEATGSRVHELREHQPVLPDAVAEPGRDHAGRPDPELDPGAAPVHGGHAVVQRPELQRRHDGHRGLGGYANSTVHHCEPRHAHVPVGEPVTPLRPSSRAAIYYGMTNYMGNYGGPGPIALMSGTIIPANNCLIGSATQPAHWCCRAQPLRGSGWGPVRIASITDGTSNTGLISERLIGHGHDSRATSMPSAVNVNPLRDPQLHDRRGRRARDRRAPGHVSVVRQCAGNHGHPVLRRQRPDVGRELSDVVGGSARTTTSARPTRSTARIARTRPTATRPGPATTSPRWEAPRPAATTRAA